MQSLLFLDRLIVSRLFPRVQLWNLNCLHQTINAPLPHLRRLALDLNFPWRARQVAYMMIPSTGIQFSLASPLLLDVPLPLRSQLTNHCLSDCPLPCLPPLSSTVITQTLILPNETGRVLVQVRLSSRLSWCLTQTPLWCRPRPLSHPLSDFTTASTKAHKQLQGSHQLQNYKLRRMNLNKSWMKMTPTEKVVLKVNSKLLRFRPLRSGWILYSRQTKWISRMPSAR